MACADFPKFIDIACNLVDPTFHGYYNGKQYHESDLEDILSRAWTNGVEKIIISSDSLFGSREAANICKNWSKQLFMTVGCHPSRSKQWAKNSDEYLADLQMVCQQNRDKVVAIGECGLDFDRLRFCNVDEQKCGFYHQLQLADETNLPLLLHSRAAHRDFLDIYAEFERCRHTESARAPLRGVVHSFSGTGAELDEILTQTSFYIGLNGCSLKTRENVAVTRQVPLDRLLLETDSPFCEIQQNHEVYRHVTTRFAWCKKEEFVPGMMVSGRNEPSTIVQVLEALAAVRSESATEIARAAYENSLNLFFRDNSSLNWA